MVFQILKSQLRLRHLYTEQKTYVQMKLPWRLFVYKV